MGIANPYCTCTLHEYLLFITGGNSVPPCSWLSVPPHPTAAAFLCPETFFFLNPATNVISAHRNTANSFWSVPGGDRDVFIHSGVGGTPPTSSPLLSPRSSPLIRSKKRGHKWKHDDLFRFLSLQLGACLINIIWAGSVQCFLRHLFWVILSLFIGIKMAQTKDPFRVACQIH